MPEAISKIPQQFMEFWNNLEKGNKTKIILISVITFLIVAVSVIVLSRPQYQSLFSSSLEAKEVGEISKQLDKLGIPYKLENNGTAIAVRKQDANKAKVSLAEAGYPKRGMTFEDLNKTQLGTTDADRKRNYQIYKENDLALALMEHIGNIKNAKVTLSIPEQTSFFNAEKNAAKASVIIESSEELTENQVTAIQRFIAGSIPNLDPKDVTVLDQNGNFLNDNKENSIAGSVDKQYALKESVTKSVEQKVKEHLAGLADSVSVMASLDFNFDQEVTNRQIVEPVIDGKGAIVSREETKETLTNGSTGGVPGTDSNPPTYPNVTTGDNGEYKKTDVKENYDWTKTQTQTTKEIGKLNKDNSSITVRLNYIPNKTNPLPKADINKVKGMVASATGIPLEKVTVENFDIQPLNTIPQPKTDYFKYLSQYGPIGLMILLIGLIALAILRRQREQIVEVPAELAMAGTNEKLSSFDAVVGEPEEELPEIDLEEKSEVKRQISNFVNKKPDAVAQLLRNWLSEDWD